MKILHVLNSPRAEGTPRLVLDWLTVTEHQHSLLFLSDTGELRSNFEQSNVFQHYNTAFLPTLLNARKIIALTKKICVDQGPEMVISWTSGFSPWVHWGARLASVKKLIVHAGNPPDKSIKGRYVFSYLNFWIGSALGNKVIACSDYIVEEYRSIPLLRDRQFSRVYNCFNSGRFTKGSGEKKRNQVIMVATLERHKDHATLLKAWKIMEDDGSKLHLLIAGDGTMKKPLKAMAVQLNLKNVSFLGSRKDIPDLLQESSVFVFSTTEQEGFGTVLLEALAAGCRIIASDVPACREVLLQGTYGTLVPPADATALANTIAIVSCQQGAEADRQKGIHYAAQFTPEKMIAEYIAIASQ